jgi:outer membrane protein OmpA-like peptidoglycan-associated protein
MKFIRGVALLAPLTLLAALTLGSAPLSPISAQGIGALKKRAEDAKKKLEDEAKKAQADSAKRKAADSTKAPAAAQAGTAAAVAPAPAATGKADPKVWDNYDFVPGNKLMFYTDFSEDKVGNFARGLKYKSGPAEVVDRDGVKVLRATGPSEFLIPMGRKLPQRFTLEIDILAPLPKDGEHDVHQMLTFEGGAETGPGAQSASVVWMTSNAWIAGGGQFYPKSNVETPAALRPLLRGAVAHIRVLMDSAYFKMYVNERRLYNIPELAFRRDSVIRLAVNAAEDQTVYFTSFRVAESETDVLYDALAAKGRWVTQGILFATGKSEIQPESRPVLKEIASTLKQHADLKILIEGHTDNVGSPASNLALSDARAAAVKATLAADYGVDGARITTKGLGDTKPSVPNTTSAGRAQNRRVEIVKQ